MNKSGKMRVVGKSPVPSDIEIAQAVEMEPVSAIAAKMGIP
jgi:hypothetical protein